LIVGSKDSVTIATRMILSVRNTGALGVIHAGESCVGTVNGGDR